MYCQVPAQQEECFESTSAACGEGPVSSPKAGIELVKVMLPCMGWAGEAARGCEGCPAGLRQSTGRDWNDELSPLARTTCTFLIKFIGSREKCIFQNLGISCRWDGGGGEELWSASDCVIFSLTRPWLSRCLGQQQQRCCWWHLLKQFRICCKYTVQLITFTVDPMSSLRYSLFSHPEFSSSAQRNTFLLQWWSES